MRALTQNSRRGFSLLLLFAGAAACGGGSEPDAYGNFEANEVSVSAQTSGQLITFTPVEGAHLAAGATVGLVDTTQLSLERAQMIAQREATSARVAEAGNQIGVYQAQLTIAQRNYERMRRLFEQSAATAQQRDQAERDYRTLVAQIAAARAQQQSVSREVASTAARVAEITDRIRKSRIINPEEGTVLATYAKAGEVVQSGRDVLFVLNRGGEDSGQRYRCNSFAEALCGAAIARYLSRQARTRSI